MTNKPHDKPPHDALTMTLAEIDTAIKEMAREYAAEAFKRENEQFLDSLRRKYGTEPVSSKICK